MMRVRRFSELAEVDHECVWFEDPRCDRFHQAVGAPDGDGSPSRYPGGFGGRRRHPTRELVAPADRGEDVLLEDIGREFEIPTPAAEIDEGCEI